MSSFWKHTYIHCSGTIVLGTDAIQGIRCDFIFDTYTLQSIVNISYIFTINNSLINGSWSHLLFANNEIPTQSHINTCNSYVVHGDASISFTIMALKLWDPFFSSCLFFSIVLHPCLLEWQKWGMFLSVSQTIVKTFLLAELLRSDQHCIIFFFWIS